MSILLDALKKSEAQRRLGSTPTLSTPGDDGSADAAQSPSWVPVTMAVVAVVVMAWFGWNQYRHDETITAGDDEPLVAGDSRPDSRAGVDRQTGPAPESPLQPNTPVASSSAMSEASRSVPLVSTGSAANRSADDVAAKRRALGKSFQSYQAPDQPEPDSAPSSPPVADVAATSAPLDSSARLAADAASAVVESRTEPDAATDSISFWQLPGSVRSRMPEMRIRVLVYASDPADRFVLIGDQRLREGDELEAGLKLEEIQRDRAVFTYRNYRFHLQG